MVGKSYRLLRSTSSISCQAAKQELFTVPDGAVVTVLEDPDDGSGMLTVKWNRTKIRMFAVDLESRGKPVTDIAIGEGARPPLTRRALTPDPKFQRHSSNEEC
jgi:hypothetical protein